MPPTIRRTRPWCKAAARSGAPAAVGPYLMATTGVLGLTIAMPMERDQKIVVGADVVLETISRLLSREAVSAHSVGYVFDDRKRLIVHSDAAKMTRVLASLAPGDGTGVKIDDPVLDAVRNMLGSVSSRAGEAVRFTVGGEPYLAEMATTGNSELLKGNTVVIAAPVSDFTGPSFDLLRKALAIAGALLVIGIILSLLVARLVSNSLSVLTRDAEQIGNLDFANTASFTRMLPRSTHWPARSAPHAAPLEPSRSTCRASLCAGSLRPARRLSEALFARK